jgi:hypothetical protein
MHLDATKRNVSVDRTRWHALDHPVTPWFESSGWMSVLGFSVVSPSLRTRYNQLHGAQSFFGSWHSLSWSRNVSPLRNPRDHNRVHNTSPLIPLLSQTNPVHSPPPYFFNIHLNVIFTCTPKFPFECHVVWCKNKIIALPNRFLVLFCHFGNLNTCVLGTVTSMDIGCSCTKPQVICSHTHLALQRDLFFNI